MDETTEDLLLDRRVRVRQSARGYRAGLDAALLAAACDAGPGQRVIEAGCGPGAALLAAATRRSEVRFTGVERDPQALTLAQENIALNGLEARVEALAGDVSRPFTGLGLPAFDAAMANPPFFDDPGAMRAPSEARRGAWMADDGLEAWIGFLTKAVREKGVVTVVHRADRLGDILALLGPKMGSVQVLGIHPFADAPAKRVLVRAVKTGKAPFRLMPPLVAHERGGAHHTPRMDAILRGEAAIDWG